MLTPIGRDIDICLKCLNWSMDNKKASGIWTDQTRNQICTQSLPNMRPPPRGKKCWKERARSPGFTTEGQKYKLSLILTTKYGNDKSLGYSSTARKQWHIGLHHSYMDTLLTDKWMLRVPALDSQDLFVLLAHALGMTLGHISVTIWQLLYLSQSPVREQRTRNALRIGATEIPLVDGKVPTFLLL